jgi:CelD/BcsL family acetyltransferase involved in cellulose biosynthesis
VPVVIGDFRGPRELDEAVPSVLAQGFTMVNLGTGRDASKTRWRPLEVPLAGAVKVGPGLRSHLGYRATSLARKIIRLARLTPRGA